MRRLSLVTGSAVVSLTALLVAPAQAGTAPVSATPVSAGVGAPAPATGCAKGPVARHLKMCVRQPGTQRLVPGRPGSSRLGSSPAGRAAAPAPTAALAAGPSDMLFWTRSYANGDPGLSIVSLPAGTSRLVPTDVLVGSSPVDYYSAAPSPDGRRLAYLRRDYASLSSSLELRDLVTGGTVVLATYPDTASTQTWLWSPAWAPTGDAVAYVVQTITATSSTFAAVRRSVFGGAPTTIATNAIAVSWARSGTICYTELDPPTGTTQLKVLIGTAPAAVVTGSAGALDTAWSPDSATIAFSRFDINATTAATSLATLPPAGGTPTELVPPDADNETPSWSADGQSVYFTRDLLDSGGSPSHLAELHRVAVTGGPSAAVYGAGTDNLWVSASATATAPVIPPAGMTHDFTGTGNADLLARAGDGSLRLYTGTGGGLSASRVIGIGWNGFTALLTPEDWDGNGYPDVIGRTAAGDLLVYFWNGSVFTGHARIGIGWNGVSLLFSPGDFTGDGHPDLIGRAPDGLLYLWTGNGIGVSGRTVIGTGWNGMTALFSGGDFTGDGRADVLARSSDGLLRLYYGTGVVVSGSRVIGTGWNGLSVLLSPADWNGDGHPDIIGRTSTGDLWEYSWNGTNITGRIGIGIGWNGMTALL